MSAPRGCNCDVCVADRRALDRAFPELRESVSEGEGREATPPLPPFAGEETVAGLGVPVPAPSPSPAAVSRGGEPPAPPSCSWGPAWVGGWWWAVSDGALVWWLRSAPSRWVRSGETLQEQVWRLAWASRGSR